MTPAEDNKQLERVLAMIAEERIKDRKRALRYYGPEIRKLNKELKALNKEK